MSDIPAILQNLPATPLAIVALAMIILGGLAYFLFRTERRVGYRAFAFALTLVGLGLAVFAVIVMDRDTRVGPVTSSSLSSSEVSEASVSSSSPAAPVPEVADLDCSDVDFSLATSLAVQHANWCGTGGAKRNLFEQAKHDPTPSCLMYSAKPYASENQNQLFADAISYAQKDEDDLAMEMLDACQCHNPTDQALFKHARDEILCFLKNQ